MAWEEVTHRDGQRLEQDTAWQPCEELRFHPVNIDHVGSCSPLPIGTKVTSTTDSLSLTGSELWPWHPDNGWTLALVWATRNWTLPSLPGPLWWFDLEGLFYFVPFPNPRPYLPSSVLLQGAGYRCLFLLIMWVFSHRLTKPKQQNLLENKKLNSNPDVPNACISNSSVNNLLTSLPFSKDTIKGEIRAERTSLQSRLAY